MECLVYTEAELTLNVQADISYLQYPTYTITGCALVLGIVESIIFKKKTETAMKAKFAPESALKRKRGTKCDCARLRVRASKAVRDVEQDIRELFGLSQVSQRQAMRCTFLSD